MADNRRNQRLDTSLGERVRHFLRAGHGARMLLFRRSAAVLLVLLAGLLLWQPHTGQSAEGVTVLVAARDLPPGREVAPADLAVREIPAELVPAGALLTRSDAEGRVLGGASRSGEVLTDVRFTGLPLTTLTTGRDDHVSVPVRLADPQLAELLHPGRRVDLVTAGEETGRHAVLVRQAPVIAVRPDPEADGRGTLVLIGVPEHQAAEVAAESLSHSMTVTLR